MRALWPLIGYVVAVFLLGAVLAYPVYSVLGFFWSDVPPFYKVVHRLLKLLALLGLWPLMRWMGLSRRNEWGYGTTAGGFAIDVGLGVLFGLGSLGLVLAILVLLDARTLTPHLEIVPLAWIAILAKALAAGLVIGWVEETWFRGALFSVISKETDPLRAVWVTAVLFGTVHFIRADPASVPLLEPSWGDGFTVIAHSFYLLADATSLDSFLALVAAGFVLGLMRLHRGHIAYCIGAHAGWVAVIKIAHKFGEVNPDSRFAVLIGHYDGVIGYLAFVVFGALGVGYYGLVVRRTVTGPGAAGRSETLP